MTDFEVDKLIVVTSAKKGAKGQQLDQQLINDGLALYQEQLSDVSGTSGSVCGLCGVCMCVGVKGPARHFGATVRKEDRMAASQGAWQPAMCSLSRS